MDEQHAKDSTGIDKNTKIKSPASKNDRERIAPVQQPWAKSLATDSPSRTGSRSWKKVLQKAGNHCRIWWQENSRYINLTFPHCCFTTLRCTLQVPQKWSLNLNLEEKVLFHDKMLMTSTDYPEIWTWTYRCQRFYLASKNRYRV